MLKLKQKRFIVMAATAVTIIITTSTAFAATTLGDKLSSLFDTHGETVRSDAMQQSRADFDVLKKQTAEAVKQSVETSKKEAKTEIESHVATKRQELTNKVANAAKEYDTEVKTKKKDAVDKQKKKVDEEFAAMEAELNKVLEDSLK